MGNLSSEEVKKIAKLSALSLSEEEIEKIKAQLIDTINYISKINELDSKIRDVNETNQVTGLYNVTREDVIDLERMLSIDEALSGAHEIYKNYFVVQGILK